MNVGTAVEDLIGKVHKLIKRPFEVYPKVAFITEMLNCCDFGFNNGVTNLSGDGRGTSFFENISLSALCDPLVCLESITF